MSAQCNLIDSLALTFNINDYSYLLQKRERPRSSAPDSASGLMFESFSLMLTRCFCTSIADAILRAAPEVASAESFHLGGSREIGRAHFAERANEATALDLVKR